jgi:hypothetical protein
VFGGGGGAGTRQEGQGSCQHNEEAICRKIVRDTRVLVVATNAQVAAGNQSQRRQNRLCQITYMICGLAEETLKHPCDSVHPELPLGPGPINQNLCTKPYRPGPVARRICHTTVQNKRDQACFAPTTPMFWYGSWYGSWYVTSVCHTLLTCDV